MESGEILIWWIVTFTLVIIVAKAAFSKPSSSPQVTTEPKQELRIVMVSPQDRGSILNILPGLLAVVVGVLLITGRTDLLALAVSYLLDLITALFGEAAEALESVESVEAGVIA